MEMMSESVDVVEELGVAIGGCAAGVSSGWLEWSEVLDSEALLQDDVLEELVVRPVLGGDSSDDEEEEDE